LRKKSSRNAQFQPNDAFKVWNSVFAGDPCRHPFLKQAPGELFLYDPADGKASPTYRFYPSVTLPDRLVTNQIGWRGAPIEVPRGPRTVRIVFAGSSTVVDGHFAPCSYPEYVGHWLNLWAQSKKLDVRFEVLNSARESVHLDRHRQRHRIARSAAQARPRGLLRGRQPVPARTRSSSGCREGSAVRAPSTGANVSPEWLREASR
jgi:hypothetical protein